MTEEMPQRLKFSRASRIQRAGDFARLRQSGERLVLGCLIANWKRLPTAARSRLGVITSAKIGVAVVRTRARRLLREAYRRHQHELAAPIDLVLVARPSIARKGLASVEKDFLTTLGKARLLVRPQGV